MSDKTKIAWKRFALKLARKIMWRVDEWLHAQELKLRQVVEPITAPVLMPDVVIATPPTPANEIVWSDEVEEKPRKPRAKRQRGIPASAFDLRFSQ